MSPAIPGLAPPRPIPLKDRSSIMFIERGHVDVLDGSFVVVDERGVRTQVPVGFYSSRTREMIWELVVGAIGQGNAVMAWSATNDAGYDLQVCGLNRRVPVDFDGFKFVSFEPESEL